MQIIGNEINPKMGKVSLWGLKKSNSLILFPLVIILQSEWKTFKISNGKKLFQLFSRLLYQKDHELKCLIYNKNHKFLTVHQLITKGLVDSGMQSDHKNYELFHHSFQKQGPEKFQFLWKYNNFDFQSFKIAKSKGKTVFPEWTEGVKNKTE